MTSSSDPIQVSGLTFGFELNEQLLNNSGPLVSGAATPRSLSPCAVPMTPVADSKCSVVIVNNNSSSNVATAAGGGGAGVTDDPQGVSAPGDRFTARYLAPQTHGDITETYNHDKIVTYVGLGMSCYTNSLFQIILMCFGIF